MSGLEHSITLEPGDVVGILVGNKVAKLTVNHVSVSHESIRPPKVNQCNPLWADDPLTPDVSLTICNVGCLACSAYSLAMLAGYDRDLPMFLKELYDAGAFCAAYLCAPLAVDNVVDGLRWKPVVYDRVSHNPRQVWRRGPADVDLLSRVLDRQPVVVQVDYDPSDRDVDTHFVVAYKYIGVPIPGGIGDDLLIMDPMGGRYTSVLEYFNPDWLSDGSMPDGVTKVARTVTGARIWTLTSK